MITKENVPSSPIGVQWEFQPRSAALSDLSIRATTLDAWSLPLEAVMSYGGVISDFVREIGTRAPLAFRCGEPDAGDPNRWDLVHRSQLGETLSSMLPAYVVYDAAKLTASQLPIFEKEIYKETDAITVLPVGQDMIFLKELLLRTRLQLSLDLDQLPSNETDRARIFETIFKDHLRVSEIRLQPTRENLELWQALVFDYSCSAACILKWSEPQTPWSQIKTTLTAAQALRSGIKIPATALNVISQPISALDQAFTEVFPQLRAHMPVALLKEIWGEFNYALGEDNSREWEAYSQLRLWPMFLKMHSSDSPEWVELAQLEWARFSAEFHPADEITERAKLKVDELKPNPSLQIVRTRTAMIAITRNRHFAQTQLFEKDLDWMSAGLIDEISEAPKISEQGLLAHATGLRAPSGSQPTTEEWQRTLKTLIGDGVILASPNEQ